MKPDQIELWQQLEVSLSSLLSSTVSQLDPATREIVTEFIENREYGVALEWLADAVSEQEIQMSEEQQAAFDRLAKHMGIDLTR